MTRRERWCPTGCGKRITNVCHKGSDGKKVSIWSCPVCKLTIILMNHDINMKRNIDTCLDIAEEVLPRFFRMYR